MLSIVTGIVAVVSLGLGPALARAAAWDDWFNGGYAKCVMVNGNAAEQAANAKKCFDYHYANDSKIQSVSQAVQAKFEDFVRHVPRDALVSAQAQCRQDVDSPLSYWKCIQSKIGGQSGSGDLQSAIAGLTKITEGPLKHCLGRIEAGVFSPRGKPRSISEALEDAAADPKSLSSSLYQLRDRFVNEFGGSVETCMPKLKSVCLCQALDSNKFDWINNNVGVRVLDVEVLSSHADGNTRIFSAISSNESQLAEKASTAPPPPPPTATTSTTVNVATVNPSSCGVGTPLNVWNPARDRAVRAGADSAEIKALQCPVQAAFAIAGSNPGKGMAWLYHEKYYNDLNLSAGGGAGSMGDPSAAIRTFLENTPKDKLDDMRARCKDSLPKSVDVSPLDFWFCMAMEAKGKNPSPQTDRLFNLTRKGIEYGRYGLAACIARIGERPANQGDCNPARKGDDTICIQNAGRTLTRIAKDAGVTSPYDPDGGDGSNNSTQTIIENFANAPNKLLYKIIDWGKENCGGNKPQTSCLCAWGQYSAQTWRWLGQAYSGTPTSSSPDNDDKQFVRKFIDFKNDGPGTTIINDSSFSDPQLVGLPTERTDAKKKAAKAAAPKKPNWMPFGSPADGNEPAIARCIQDQADLVINGGVLCANCNTIQNEAGSFFPGSVVPANFGNANDPNVPLGIELKKDIGVAYKMMRVYEGQARLLAISRLLKARKFYTGTSAISDTDALKACAGLSFDNPDILQNPGIPNSTVDVMDFIEKNQANVESAVSPDTRFDSTMILADALRARYEQQGAAGAVVSDNSCDAMTGQSCTYQIQNRECSNDRYMEVLQKNPYIQVGSKPGAFNDSTFNSKTYFKDSLPGMNSVLEEVPEDIAKPPPLKPEGHYFPIAPCGKFKTDQTKVTGPDGRIIHWSLDQNGFYDPKNKSGCFDSDGSTNGKCKIEGGIIVFGELTKEERELYDKHVREHFEQKARELLVDPNIKAKVDAKVQKLYADLGKEYDAQIGQYCGNGSPRSSRDVLLLMSQMSPAPFTTNRDFRVRGPAACYKSFFDGEIALKKIGDTVVNAGCFIGGLALAAATRGALALGARALNLACIGYAAYSSAADEAVARADFARRAGVSTAANTSASLASTNEMQQLIQQADASAEGRGLLYLFAAMEGIGTLGVIKNLTKLPVAEKGVQGMVTGMESALQKRWGIEGAELEARQGMITKLVNETKGKLTPALEAKMKDPFNGPMSPWNMTNKPGGFPGGTYGMKLMPSGKWKMLVGGIEYGPEMTVAEMKAMAPKGFNIDLDLGEGLGSVTKIDPAKPTIFREPAAPSTAIVKANPPGPLVVVPGGGGMGTAAAGIKVVPPVEPLKVPPPPPGLNPPQLGAGAGTPVTAKILKPTLVETTTNGAIYEIDLATLDDTGLGAKYPDVDSLRAARKEIREMKQLYKFTQDQPQLAAKLGARVENGKLRFASNTELAARIRAMRAAGDPLAPMFEPAPVSGQVTPQQHLELLAEGKYPCTNDMHDLGYHTSGYAILDAATANQIRNNAKTLLELNKYLNALPTNAETGPIRAMVGSAMVQNSNTVDLVTATLGDGLAAGPGQVSAMSSLQNLWTQSDIIQFFLEESRAMAKSPDLIKKIDEAMANINKTPSPPGPTMDDTTKKFFARYGAAVGNPAPTLVLSARVAGVEAESAALDLAALDFPEFASTRKIIATGTSLARKEAMLLKQEEDFIALLKKRYPEYPELAEDMARVLVDGDPARAKAAADKLVAVLAKGQGGEALAEANQISDLLLDSQKKPCVLSRLKEILDDYKSSMTSCGVKP